MQPKGIDQRLLVGIFTLLFLIVLGGTFFLGMHVGQYRSSAHSLRFLREAGLSPDIMPPMKRGRRDRHGIAGEVLAVSGSVITILDARQQERKLLIGSGTNVGGMNLEEDISDIVIGSYVIGFGKPGVGDTVQVKRLMRKSW